jgi:chemotaxis protein MotB
MRISELENFKVENKLNPFYISFSDLMLLLTAFFVMIIGMSKIEVGSFEQLRVGFTGDIKGTLTELAQKLEKTAQGVKGVTVSRDKDGVRIDLDTQILFDTGSSVLRPGALQPLIPLMRVIVKTKYMIDIEGHTDDRPFFRRVGHEIETNWSLSGRRSSSVANFLIDYGFDESRLRIIGYASNLPRLDIGKLSGAKLDNARAKNRRVSLLVR